MLFEDYAIKIQSAYKGFYIRKKLKIYYNLPRDLQRKIIWHINRDIYLKHFHSSIFKIIKIRYLKFINNYDIVLSKKLNDFYNFYIFELFSLIKLSFKYELIIDKKKISTQILCVKMIIYKIADENYFINNHDYMLMAKYNKYFTST